MKNIVDFKIKIVTRRIYFIIKLINFFNSIRPLSFENYNFYRNLFVKGDGLSIKGSNGLIAFIHYCYFILKGDGFLKFTEVEINFKNIEQNFYFKKDQYYVLNRKGAMLNKEGLQKMFIDFLIDRNAGAIAISKSYSIYGTLDDEPIILYRSKNDSVHTLKQIFKNLENHKSIVVGKNSFLMSQSEIVAMYFLFGLSCKSELSCQMNIHFDNYKSIIDKYFNNEGVDFDFSDDKFVRLLGYYSGSVNEKIDINRLNIFISNRKKIRKCLLISKTISDYGGNQKTAVQIYKELSGSYDVKVFCMNDDKFTNEIPTVDIIKFESIQNIIYHINNNKYIFIIVNNLNQITEFISDLTNQKITFLTHNCMAPFNSTLLKHKDLIKSVLCVNESIARKLKNKGVSCPIEVYKNTIKTTHKINTRSSFKNKMAFIGRLSPEKNVKLLIETWKEFSKLFDVELLVIGDHMNYQIEQNEKIKFVGYLERDSIQDILNEVDYVVLPSYTEGMPHSLIEAMSIGIPCIGSNINGLNELIKKNERGFLFELNGYNEVSEEIDAGLGFNKVINSVNIHFNENKNNLLNTLMEAYSITIENWNKMSVNCVDYISLNYEETSQKRSNIKKIESVISE